MSIHMNWSTSVLTGLSSDTEPTILVTFDNAKYIFNVGENTNRAFLQSARNWKKTRAIFLSAVGTRRASGLPGLLMTLADAGMSKLSVAGPPGLVHFLASTRTFAYRENLAIDPIEVLLPSEDTSCLQSIYQDENISVYAAAVIPSSGDSSSAGASERLKRKRTPSPDTIAKRSAHSNSSTFSGRNSGIDTRSSNLHRPLPSFVLPQVQPHSFPSAITLAYIIIGPRLRGKFSEEKAMRLGLPQGSIRGRLVRGETVSFTVDDGNGGRLERIVRPEDCVSKSESRGAILILDTPSPSHIPVLIASLSDSELFNQLRLQGHSPRADEANDRLRVVFHLCGDAVLEDSRYKAFMRSFARDVDHVVASREHNADPITFTSAAYNMLRLNKLDPILFPVPNFELSAPNKLSSVDGLPENILPMHSNIHVEFRPYRRPTEEHQSKSDPVTQDFINVPLSALTLASFAEAKARVEESFHESGPSPHPGQNVTIIPLGTGSAVPSKYRNVSGTLLQIPGWGNILLEAGEGTWGQLVRTIGSQDLQQFLKNLKCIFISHNHADHHIGLPKLLSMRRQCLGRSACEPVYLIAHRPIFQYLHEYDELEPLGFHDQNGASVLPILCETLLRNQSDVGHRANSNSLLHGSSPWLDIQASHRATSHLCRTLGLKQIITVDVRHRTRCFGLVLRHVDGWSIVFSGDTMPSNPLIREGEDATLLIHEATMADDQVDLASAKAHSTVGQALQVAERMKAKNVLLTHFSARYPKMPPGIVHGHDVQRGHILGLAFDQIRVTIGDMYKLNLYLPAIEQSFLDSKEEGDDETDVAIARAVET